MIERKFLINNSQIVLIIHYYSGSQCYKFNFAFIKELKGKRKQYVIYRCKFQFKRYISGKKIALFQHNSIFSAPFNKLSAFLSSSILHRFVTSLFYYGSILFKEDFEERNNPRCRHLHSYPSFHFLREMKAFLSSFILPWKRLFLNPDPFS